MNEEDLKQISQMINNLATKVDNKIEELTKSVGKTIEEKQENTEREINKNPIAYVTGAFFGGVIVGYIIGNKK
jgi:capsular polysaccharide biosynthesis protein